jgi:hypothetical protein
MGVENISKWMGAENVSKWMGAEIVSKWMGAEYVSKWMGAENVSSPDFQTRTVHANFSFYLTAVYLIINLYGAK